MIHSQKLQLIFIQVQKWYFHIYLYDWLFNSGPSIGFMCSFWTRGYWNISSKISSFFEKHAASVFSQVLFQSPKLTSMCEKNSRWRFQWLCYSFSRAASFIQPYTDFHIFASLFFLSPYNGTKMTAEKRKLALTMVVSLYLSLNEVLIYIKIARLEGQNTLRHHPHFKDLQSVKAMDLIVSRIGNVLNIFCYHNCPYMLPSFEKALCKIFATNTATLDLRTEQQNGNCQGRGKGCSRSGKKHYGESFCCKGSGEQGELAARMMQVLTRQQQLSQMLRTIRLISQLHLASF